MMKKLLCLFVLLALAGSASAGTAYWANGVASGDWEVASNWTASSGAAPPYDATNSVFGYRLDNGSSSITITSSGSAKAYHYIMTPDGTAAVNASLTINASSDLQVVRNVQQFSTNANATTTMTIYGTLNACDSATTTAYNYNLSSGTGKNSNDTIDVYGVLNVLTRSGGSGVPRLTICNTGNVAGSGTVNIYDGGVVDVYSYLIGTKGAGHIYIELGGIMWINGDATSQVSTDILGLKIQKLGEIGTLEYGISGGKTWVGVVPEPATVALLGLGGLLLCRKKR
jgi:hypothetical protein